MHIIRIILSPLIVVLAMAASAGGAANAVTVPVPAKFPGPMLQRFLDGPMREVKEIVFAVRVPGHDHWYVTFSNYSDFSEIPAKLGFKNEDGVYWGYGEGGRLCAMDLRSRKIRVLLDDPKGGVRDPQLHYSGNKIIFAYRKGGTHPFHLYEINIDGTGLRQLTDGTDDDIEPTYCPDGSIVFGSSRCRRFVNCWYTRVATLHRCDGDGKNVRMLSSNNDHDNTPWMLPDGRILYMRWEYVDRSQVHFHHLWTMFPDGTAQMVFYGNSRGGITMLDAKPIPGSDKIVSIFSPGHGRPEHLGPVTIVDQRLGPDDLSAARQIGKGTEWKDPYAFSENCFLVAHKKGIFVMNGNGDSELIYQLPPEESQFQCHEPRPIMPRPREKLITNRTNLAQPTGELFLQDVYHGRNMAGVNRGDIRKLLVLKQLPKPINFSGGMEPLTIGGSFTLAEIVGEVPVEPDGTVCMEVPALQSLFFVALDKNDIAVKRMHSFVTVQPGEVTGCVGCHEFRQTALPASAKRSQVIRRGSTPVVPIRDVPGVIDYSRDIQPILDRHCVSCHNPDKRDGEVDLCGDKTSSYTVSYWTMRTRNLVIDARNEPRGNREPYTYGSATSRLMKLIDGSHYGASLTDIERKTVRLWIETSATYPGTYAALGCGSYGAGLPMGTMMKRCGSCHTENVKDRKGKVQPRLVFNDDWGWRTEPFCNLSHPEKSLMLRAPLAKEAGGFALCEAITFKDTSDPLYKQILASIQNAQDRLMAGKRFDMAGFRPNQHYIREMQRFGFLPKDLAPDAAIDVYATDRAYWNSFIYQPMKVQLSAR